MTLLINTEVTGKTTYNKWLEIEFLDKEWTTASGNKKPWTAQKKMEGPNYRSRNRP
jgi:hypothetical protein